MLGHLVIGFVFGQPWIPFPYLPQLEINPGIFQQVNKMMNVSSFDCGSFGVAVFFLITGYTTVMALKKDCSYKFFIKKVLRLYPTYILGFSVTVLCIVSFCVARELAIPFTIRNYLIHMTFFRNFLGSKYIDNGVWTLEVYMDFYILMWLAFQVAKRKGKKVGCDETVVLSTTLLTFNFFCVYCARVGCSGRILAVLTALFDLSSFLIFSLLGTLFYFLLNKEIGQRKFFASLIIILAEFIASCYFRGMAFYTSILSVENYIYGLAVFGLFYAMRSSFRNNKIIIFLGEISYPLYIVHALIGFLLQSILLEKGCSIYVAVLASISVAISFAYFLNRTVEKWSGELSKKILNQLK